MIRRIATLVLAGLFCVSAPVNAGTPIEIEMVCPVGGEEFTHWSTASYSTFGQRPDGKPYGSWTFPLAIPECPENKLVMYREFEEDEIAALTELIQSDGYKALHQETTYYRASWLSERMDPDAGLSPIFLLMRAVWQLDELPEMKARYQREFATRAGAVPIDADNLDTLFLRYRVANTWRELGDFDAANAALDAIPTKPLDVGMPEGDEVPYEQREEAEARRYLLEAISDMRKVNASGDTSSEPLDLMPDRYAMWKCDELIEAGETPLPSRCEDPELLETLAEMKERQAQYETESAAEAAAEAVGGDDGA